MAAGGYEISAAWKKLSQSERRYLSVSLDDSTFPATVYASLLENEDGTHTIGFCKLVSTGVYACSSRRPLKRTVRQATNVKHLTLTATLLGLLFGFFAKADDYQVVTEDWAPYNYLENDQITGMATDIIRAIMALTGDEFQMELLPSMRATRALQTRDKTIMFALFRTAEREPLYKWVGPILEASIHPYQLATSPQPVTSMEQLLSAPKITTRHAGLVPDLLQSRGFNNLDKSVARSPQLYRMLLAGRADIIIGDTDAGVAYYSNRLKIAPGTLRRIPVDIYRSALYIAFSPDSDDELVAEWASALEKLRSSGELARIQRHYERPIGQLPRR